MGASRGPAQLDAFEAATVAQVSRTHPDADLIALRASFNLIRLATRHGHLMESRVHREAGWSLAGFRVMFCSWVCGDLEPREIARLSGLSRAAVSSALNTLERDGLVGRHRESADRRLVTVRLTPAGRTRVAAAYSKANEVERRFFAALTADQVHDFVTMTRTLLGHSIDQSASTNTDTASPDTRSTGAPSTRSAIARTRSKTRGAAVPT